MADPVSYSKPLSPLKELHNSKPITRTDKSLSFTDHKLCKPLFFVLFLFLIPLFPSQAPEFISQSTIFIKFRDLAPPLFIGLAVCYGLFSRRNVEDFDSEPPLHYSDDSQSSYVSRIFQVPPISYDGPEKLSRYDDKNVNQNLNSQYYSGESMVNGTNGHELNKTGSQYCRDDESMVSGTKGHELNKTGSRYCRDGESMVNGINDHELNKTGSQYFRDDESMADDTNGNEQNEGGSLNAENDSENSFENGDSNVVQALNSQYFQSKSMVVGSQPNYSLDEYGNLGQVGQVNDYRSLGLPNRSLNPRIRILDGSLLNKSATSFLASCSSDGSGRIENENDFGDIPPTSFEEGFNETVALSDEIPWHPRSEMKEIREKVGSFAGDSSHFRSLSDDETQFESLKSQSFRSTTSLSFQRSPGPKPLGPSLSRPLSVDGAQLESLKSQSFRSTASLSSQGSSSSYSPTTLSPTHSVSSELPNSETEELGKSKSYRASYPPASQSLATWKAGPPLNAFHLRRYNGGSLFPKDSRRSLKDGLKDLKGKWNEHTVGSGEMGQGSLRSDQKPEVYVKTSSLKGRFIRTIRASGYAAETIKAGEVSRNHIDEKVGKICDEALTVNVGKNEMKRGPDNMLHGSDKKNSDTHHHLPKPTHSKYKKNEREVFSESLTVEFIEESESKTGNSRVSSDEHAVHHVNTLHGSDKKSSDTNHHVPKPTHSKYKKNEREVFSDSLTVESTEESESKTANSIMSSDEHSVPATDIDAGDYSSEVDKKAGEFIAKFREQIRLQKVASTERSRGKRLIDTHAR
ncbi:hypothetical protein SADUNF_Sadunf02G0114800 [Salix dunnii]|uniref:Uncharacterized protein n=1 Tax=Salix dunnii TaxID=1413687 RepID=A0A835TGX0_9ROSI|nr:hypothetical protein SADUNF_Sadunf02G0114800 [Salix dunnii]